MPNSVKIGFEHQVYILPLCDLLPSKTLSLAIRETAKYKRIAQSIAQLGLVEPLVVTRPSKSGPYLLLDGHVRFNVLKDQSLKDARCIIAHEDEAFTFNKRICGVAAIQEHRMIARAIDSGVSEERLARTLGVVVKTIKARRNLLAGISPDVAEILKDKPIGHHAFESLRKMKSMRQLEVAELMISANNFTNNYVKALLATTKPADLIKPDDPKKGTGLSPEQMSRLEREMASVSSDYKELEASYGDDMLLLVIASGYLERLVSRPEIARFLTNQYPDFLENFRAIAAATSLDQAGMPA
ncbi:MAG: ParB-like nuclease [Candidatus Sulfotelmatobacter sp.]|nr:ParB-like nuclease [Candidatus Sulfotelmatobacter sp.]